MGTKVNQINIYWDEQKTKLHSSYSIIIPDGIKEGIHQYFYPNGNIWEESLYSNGKMSGNHIFWFPNGVKCFQSQYLNGFKHGIHTEWYQNGVIKLKHYYHFGKKHGIHQYWSSNNNLLIQCRYFKNILNGAYIYMISGNKYNETLYLNGIKISESERINTFKTQYGEIWKNILWEYMNYIWFKAGVHSIFYLHHI